jgi:tetratricopeptide (TPR) repeat protein
VSKLVIFRGDAVESEVRLAGRPVRIGRDHRNDIVLDDKSVSRFHAEVRTEGDKYFIVDLKSRNGVWVNGRQAKGKTELVFGSAVNLGTFELALEDDVPTWEFGEEPSVIDQPRAVIAQLVDQPDRPSRSVTRAATRAPAATTTRLATWARRQGRSWARAAAAVLLIAGVTFAVVRYQDLRSASREAIDVPAAPQSPPLRTVSPAVPSTEDPIKETIDQHLVDARAAIDHRDFATALRDHLAPVLELDPGNQEALDLKRQSDAAMQRGRPPEAAATPQPPAEIETPGIARKAGETWTDYTARVQRIALNLQEGKINVGRQNFALAIARFRLVERDQPKYQGLDVLLAEALGKQQKALEEAMSSGRQNEQAGNLRVARQWYQRAMEVDPNNSTMARDKNAQLLNRMTTEANRLLNQANAALKLGETERAARLYQQIVDSLLPGDEIREKAAKELERSRR